MTELRSVSPAPGCRSAAGIAADVNAGRIAPDAASRASLAAIAALNGAVNAVVDHDPGLAAPQLAALQERLERGEKPALAGVPVLVKDHFHVAGWKVTQGSRLFAEAVAPADDPVVARLRQAGAILIGRSNMSEFGCKGMTTNLLYGTSRHPMDLSRTTGGSSGGAAAALGARMVPLALVSDGGGSARRPAAHVGAVGFKPSAGIVAAPRELSATSVVAPMALSVGDAALMFEVIRGAHPEDPHSISAPPFLAVRDRPRLAWSPRLGLDVPVDADVTAAMQAVVDALRTAGHDLVARDPLWPEGAGEDAVMPMQHAALAARLGTRWRQDPDLFDPDIGDQIEAGLALDGATVAAAIATSSAIAGAAARFFAAGTDFLLSPTIPCTAWPNNRLGPERIGGQNVAHRGHAVFTPLVNHALCPAISIPAGTGAGGLPVGLQIIGPRFADLALLDIARRIETVLVGAGLVPAAPA